MSEYIKPSKETKLFNKLLSILANHASNEAKLDEDLQNTTFDNYDEKQLEIWATKLQTLVLFNRLALFTARKLRDYKNSNYDYFSHIIYIFIFIFFTLFSFSIVNYAIFKIDDTMFLINYESSPNLFIFFYYSLNGLFFNSIIEITPVGTLSRTVSMSEYAVAFLIITIIIGMLTTAFNKKRNNEIDSLIKKIEIQSSNMESLIIKEFNVSNISNAIEELDKAKTSLIKSIYYLSKNI